MKNNFKKTISLVMTVLMLMTCWVFVAPEKAEAAGAYGMPAANNGSNRGTITFYPKDAGDYLTVNYPSKIYLDKTETLQSAGYQIYLTGHFGNSTNHNTWISCNIWGGVGTSSSSDLKDKRMRDTYFSGLDYTVSNASSTLANAKYTNKEFDSGNTYVICYYGGDFSGTVNLQGTPRGLFDGAVFDADGGNNSAQPCLIAMRKSGSSGYDNRVWLNSGSGSKYTGDIYMQIYVYDKEGLNNAVGKADSLYNSINGYTS